MFNLFAAAASNRAEKRCQQLALCLSVYVYKLLPESTKADMSSVVIYFGDKIYVLTILQLDKMEMEVKLVNMEAH